ncbi:MAG: hypothetical protein IGR92_03585 [Leptolyngbyaceae cyanobacterium T60_A2020_046]|nr:hypothetical protein [Leptolyngbyaceae cyanobacterium T60_A2020_046]
MTPSLSCCMVHEGQGTGASFSDPGLDSNTEMMRDRVDHGLSAVDHRPL